MVLEFAEQATHEQGTSRGVSLEIVGDHDGYPSSLLLTSHSGTYLLTEHISGASRSDPAIEPAIAPVEQAKAVNLAVIARCLDQALPTSAFVRPDTGESRVKGNLDLILQIQVGLR